ncbi:MAG: GNAT family acetyltransferase [Hyphomicrobiales bacterium]|nr:GNAT family acetyltransferase [Hyphomicrobiales bacterium]
MPTDIVIAPITDADVAAVVDLWSRCGLIRPWNDPIADIALARASGDAEVLAARVGGAIVGATMIGHDGHRGAVYYLAVDAERRLGGLGRRLVAAAEDWCRARGVPKINLLVRKENAGVMAFYAALGFADTRSVSLYKTLDADVAEREAAQKADWAAKIATKA